MLCLCVGVRTLYVSEEYQLRSHRGDIAENAHQSLIVIVTRRRLVQTQDLGQFTVGDPGLKRKVSSTLFYPRVKVPKINVQIRIDGVPCLLCENRDLLLVD